MREAKRNALREAWHGPLTAHQVAEANKISERGLRYFWNAEKAAGRLPAEPAPRPHFAVRCKPAVVADDEISDVSGAAPIADPNPRHEAECDASLAALRRHHADLDNPLAQKASLAWLVWDHTRPAIGPTHGQLMAMCRAHDQRVRA